MAPRELPEFRPKLRVSATPGFDCIALVVKICVMHSLYNFDFSVGLRSNSKSKGWSEKFFSSGADVFTVYIGKADHLAVRLSQLSSILIRIFMGRRNSDPSAIEFTSLILDDSLSSAVNEKLLISSYIH